MRSRETLRKWTLRLLPGQTDCSQGAAWELLRALLVSFTTNLTELARQADRSTPTRGTRQFFHRWLARPHWEPLAIYAALPELLPQAWKGRALIPLLVDFTHLGGGGAGWSVLQVSIVWERRALTVYRAIIPRSRPETGQLQLVLHACDWLAMTLPGSRSRYVLVMDRGFPSHELINELQGRGWRFVLRVHADWKVQHVRFRGRLRDAHQAGLVTGRARWFGGVILGWRTTGPAVHRHSCTTNLVWYRGPGHQEPWFLVTSERRAERTVEIYRQRMRIEAEFRDLKGPWGLDELVKWQDREEVARFLAWVAVYEWRLAYLWCVHQLQRLARQFEVYGSLSWIRLAREWLARELRPPRELALDCL